jgi:hypothetical protein
LETGPLLERHFAEEALSKKGEQVEVSSLVIMIINPQTDNKTVFK